MAGRQDNRNRDPWDTLFNRLPLTKLSSRQTYATVVIGSTSLVAIACLAFGQLGPIGALGLFVGFAVFADHVFHSGHDT